MAKLICFSLLNKFQTNKNNTYQKILYSLRAIWLWEFDCHTSASWTDEGSLRERNEKEVGLQQHLNVCPNVLEGFPGGSGSKESTCRAGDLGRSLGEEDPLEKEPATHSSIPAWRIPWTEEPGRIHPWGCKESDTVERLTLSFSECVYGTVYNLEKNYFM